MRAVITLVVLSACEEGELCTRAAEVEDRGLELGLGEDRFERALEDGMEVQVAFGSQGGQHLYLAVRTRGFGPGKRAALGQDDDVPVFTIEMSDAATGVVVTVQRFEWEAMQGDEVEAELALGEFYLPFSGYDEDGPSEYLIRAVGEDVCGNVLEDEHVIRL